MPVTKVIPIESPMPNLYLSSDQLDLFGLTPGTTLQVRAGSSVTHVKIVKSLNGNFIARNIVEALGIPTIKTLIIRKQSNDTLQIGPIIGLLVTRGRKRKIPPYSSQNKQLYSFLSYCMKQDYIGFVFYPESVDETARKVSGLFLGHNPDGTVSWQKHDFPLPDVVYDRILHRSMEKKPTSKIVKSFLMNDPQITYFNPKFLNKWETHSILSKNQELLNHLPETADFDNPDKLAELLEKYKTVYMKPIHGSLGRGIFKITVTPEGYCSQHRKGKKTYTQVFSKFDDLFKSLKVLKKNSKCVVQQGLDFLKYEDRVFDLRVLVQKNGSGQWDITAMVARIANEQSIFPNIAAGGEAVNIETVWQNLFSSSWAESETCKLTMKIGIAAAEVLETKMGTFCEVGLDIGIDKDKNIWIIEINSKPSRKVFPMDQLNLKKLSLRKPIDFAAYSAGFLPEREMSNLDK